AVAFNCVASSAVPYTIGDGVGHVTMGVSLATMRSALALLGAYKSSPANVALTALAYVPGLIPIKLTPATLATPIWSVVAVPAREPLSVKLTSRPATGEEAEVNVADKLVAPP